MNLFALDKIVRAADIFYRETIMADKHLARPFVNLTDLKQSIDMARQYISDKRNEPTTCGNSTNPTIYIKNPNGEILACLHVEGDKQNIRIRELNGVICEIS